MRKYNAQFLPIKICVVSPSRVLSIPTSVVGSKPLCTSMRHWLRMENGTMPLAPRRPPNLGKLEALSMFRLQRQYLIICEFNVVLPPSLRAQEINIQTPTSDDGGTSLGSGNLRASLSGLRETLNRILGEPKEDGYEQGSRCIRPCNSTLFDSPHDEGYWLPHPREAMGNWEV